VRHALRHRTDDTPAAEECPERDGGMGTNDDPERDRELARRGTPGRSDRRDDEDEGDDSHPFLSVVRPVRHAIEEARDELQAFELVVHLRRGVSAEQTDDHEREAEREREPDERRGDHVHHDLDKPFQEDLSEDDRREESREQTGQDRRPERRPVPPDDDVIGEEDRKSTRLNSSHRTISYAVFCLKKKKQTQIHPCRRYDGNSSTLVLCQQLPNSLPALTRNYDFRRRPALLL